MLIIGMLLHYFGVHFCAFFKVPRVLRARKFAHSQNADAATYLFTFLRCLIVELLLGSLFVLKANVEDEQHKRAEKQPADQVQKLTSLTES
jgi:hypothetical protein